MMATPDDVTGPVNLGNPSERTVLSLAEKVIHLTGTEGKIVHRALPSDDPSRRCPDISLAKELLGWAPTVNIDEGLRRTVEWFSEMAR